MAQMQVIEKFDVHQPLLRYHQSKLTKTKFRIEGRDILAYKLDDNFYSIIENLTKRRTAVSNNKKPKATRIKYPVNCKPEYTEYDKEVITSLKELLADEKCSLSAYLTKQYT
jgi:hypothetical protein